MAMLGQWPSTTPISVIVYLCFLNECKHFPDIDAVIRSLHKARSCEQRKMPIQPTAMKLRLILIASLALSLVCQLPGQATRPLPQVDRVLIISIDGLRPDLVFRANTPNLHKLLNEGAFSLWAQTVPIANTLPSHVSMLTGVSVEKHGIDFNDERATTRPVYPHAATLFEIARRTGLTTALVSGKSKFQALASPGSVDWLWLPDDPKCTDADVAEKAVQVLTEHRPAIMFVHFPGADTAGHSKGWGSAEQLAVIEEIDQYVGRLLQTMQAAGLSDSTVVIVTADHGGSARQHGANDPPSLYIPWIVVGPGVRRNFDLTLVKGLRISTVDTFATACFILGLDLPEGTEGKPIMQILQEYELMRNTRPATQAAR